MFLNIYRAIISVAYLVAEKRNISESELHAKVIRAGGSERDFRKIRKMLVRLRLVRIEDGRVWVATADLLEELKQIEGLRKEWPRRPPKP